MDDNNITSDVVFRHSTTQEFEANDIMPKEDIETNVKSCVEIEFESPNKFKYFTIHLLRREGLKYVFNQVKLRE